MRTVGLSAKNNHKYFQTSSRKLLQSTKRRKKVNTTVIR